MSELKQPNIWPDKLMIRDTKIVPDDGGGRIYTTVGFGYVKEPYIRETLVTKLKAENERLWAEVERLRHEQAEQ